MLAIGLLPVAIVIFVIGRWSLKVSEPALALTRMIVQLMLIGSILTWIFESQRFSVVLLVLSVMICAAAWIALRTVPRTLEQYAFAWVSIFIGGGIPLVLATQFVLAIEPWYSPRTWITLGGMVFANGMNAVSLAAERFHSEMRREDCDWKQARGIALRAAMIPITNGLLSVGLVSIPGFMTGQILNGAQPAFAARAQMMIFCMIYSAVGLSTIGYLSLTTRKMQ